MINGLSILLIVLIIGVSILIGVLIARLAQRKKETDAQLEENAKKEQEKPTITML